jgi:hypothetical protein
MIVGHDRHRKHLTGEDVAIVVANRRNGIVLAQPLAQPHKLRGAYEGRSS